MASIAHVQPLKRFAAAAFGFCLSTATIAAAAADALDDVKITRVPATSLGRDSGKQSEISLTDCVPQMIAFATGSAWLLCVKAVPKFGLVVSQASFRKSRTSPFILVLGDGRFSEIFVPYHQGFPRLFDIGDFDAPVLPLSAGSATASDCPAPRVLLDNNQICREIRDFGIAVKNDAFVRRGREAVYFSVLDAGTYNYIAEWTFRDDGVILGRAGATGAKPGGPDDERGHMHDFTWRLDIDLNGAEGDSVCLHRHLEDLAPPLSTASDRCDPIRVEMGLQWRPLQFSSLVVSDSALRNARGRPTEYELIPLRTGASRHSELYTRNDLWVTRAKASELLALVLPTYLTAESTVRQDNAIWYTGSIHHEEHMRDEDRQVVPVMWVGFELRPRNLFDGTPFLP